MDLIFYITLEEMMNLWNLHWFSYHNNKIIQFISFITASIWFNQFYSRGLSESVTKTIVTANTLVAAIIVYCMDPDLDTSG